MAKFCTKCGKELKEGQTCSCSNKKAETKTETTKKGYFSDILPILKGTIFEPISTIKKYSTDNNIFIALILMGVCALFGGLAYALIATGTLGRIFGGLSHGELSTSIYSIAVGPTFIGSFFKTFIFIIIYYGVMLGMLLLMAKVVFKSKVSFLKVVIVLGISSLYMACGLVLGTIFAGFLPGLTTRIFALVGIFAMVQLTAACESTFEITKDQVIYVLGPAFVAEFIVFFEIFSRI